MEFNPGRLMLSNDEQYLKANRLIVFNDGGKFIFLKLSQDSNADISIVSTPLGMIIDSRDLQP